MSSMEVHTCKASYVGSESGRIKAQDHSMQKLKILS
jgi:hypothetical protein